MPIPSRVIAPGILLVVGLIAPLLAQSPGTPPPVPAEIEGKWWGPARGGSETGELGFEFTRRPNGRVLVREWLPNVNAYGSPLGFVEYKDGEYGITGANTPFTLKDGALTGTLWLPALSFTLHRTEQPLPAETEPPAVPAGPAPAWTFQAGAPLWASPVARGDLIYLGDAAGKFHAVQTADGHERWSFDAGAPIYGNATVDGDAVYFASDNGRLYRLDRRTGAETWRADIGGAGIRSLPTAEGGEWDFTNASAVVAGGRVYIGSGSGTFRALDAATGKSLWTFKSGGKFRAAALVAGDHVFAGATDNFVYAFDRRTGAVAWKFDTGSPVTTAPVLAGEKLVIGTRDQSLLFALDAATGRKLWTVFYWLSWVESTPVLAADGLLYIGASDSRRVRAIEPDTGHVRWAAQAWGWTWGTPLIVGDTVYYGTVGAAKYFITQQASLGALDRRTGTLKWRRPIPLSPQNYMSGIAGSLALAGGRIVVAGLDGTLLALPAE